MKIDNICWEGRLSAWRLDGTVGRGILVLDNKHKYSLRVYSDKNGAWPEGWESVRQNDRIRFNGKLEQPEAPGTAGEFNYSIYNAVRGLKGTVTTGEKVLVVAKGEPDLAWRIRHKVGRVLAENWPARAGVLEGILFGDSSHISPETLAMYRATGVMHIFAASGANVGFVLVLAWTLFFFMPPRGRILATLMFILLYAALCQGNPPVLRATILGAAVLGGRLLGSGEISSLRWLVLTALLMYIYNPLYLRDISFLLSFAATWGIIVLAPHLESMRALASLPRVLKSAVAVTFGAQLASLPILVDVFHQLSLAGFVTNVFVLFVFGAVLQLGLIGCLLIWVPVMHLLFFQAAFWLLRGTDALLGLAASFPLAYFWVLNPGGWFWVLWYGTIAIMLFGRDRVIFIFQVQLRKLYKLAKIYYLAGKRKNGLVLASVSIFIIAVFLLAFSGSQDRLIITFLDVGQGDCILIRSKNERLMVDSGPRTEKFDAGEKIVFPYLMEKRIDSLDMLLLTHEDGDHAGGARYLLTNIPVKTVTIPEVRAESDLDIWKGNIPPSILYSKEKLIRLKAGDSLDFASGLKIKVLAPIDVSKEITGNTHSLVLLLDYLGYRILLTGDMDREEMEELFNRGESWDADFLKIPHHGSKGSLDPHWFDQMSPRAVFISVGSNSFGHPAPEVLAYWQERGVPVYRTDLQGTIQLIINQRGYEIITGRDMEMEPAIGSLSGNLLSGILEWYNLQIRLK
ncbi:MAG: DNA internalization-related competence protein ComEC/Rec2 [Peptococcaceae bacterium]|nr:DNA internalization-related competence protein ComEC/Rec2 [Peptococcaceae bacterium]